MATGNVEIPDPKVTNRIRLVTTAHPEEWVSPYTGEQALAIALFNSHAAGTLDDSMRLAHNAMPYLDSMTFEIRQKA